MKQLLEHFHAIGADSLHHRLETGNDPVIDIEQSVLAGGMDAGRLDDGQAAAAFGPGDMIGDGVLIEGVPGEMGAVSGTDDPVGISTAPILIGSNTLASVIASPLSFN